jgi:SAM-dependent methyltransferase
MQAEFGVDFPLVLANAERVPFRDHSFGFAISEYGASLWCDPHRWIPEADRQAAAGGRLVFLRPSPLFALCAPAEGQVSRALLRPQFGLRRLDWDKCAEFNLPHGEMLRLLRSHGFLVEDLIEIQAPRDAHRDYPRVSAEWAHNWPSEEIWKARLAG